MSYTRPAYNAANVTWQGAQAYTRPAAAAADAEWEALVPAGIISTPSPLGAPSAYGSADVPAEGVVVAPGPLAPPGALGTVVVVARADVPSPLGAPVLRGAVVAVGNVAAPSPLGSPHIAGTVRRYELRGEVRDQGVLVNRRVRAHRRDTGALVAEADTVAGVFVLPAGFAADEYYLVPINLDAGATDFSPPCANRVTSVLAMDPV